MLVLHHAITSEWERGEGANERCVCVWARRVRVRFDYPGYPTEQPQEGFVRGVRKYVRVTVLEHGRMYMYVPTCADTSMQVGVGECGK